MCASIEITMSGRSARRERLAARRGHQRSLKHCARGMRERWRKRRRRLGCLSRRDYLEINRRRGPEGVGADDQPGEEPAPEAEGHPADGRDMPRSEAAGPEGLVAGTSSAESEREMDAFSQREGLNMEREVRRLRRQLQDAETEAQKQAKKNRRDMEQLVRRLTEEHMRDLWTKRFRTTSPFVSELPSSITRGSSHSTSGSEGRGAVGSSPGSGESASRKGGRETEQPAVGRTQEVSNRRVRQINQMEIQMVGRRPSTKRRCQAVTSLTMGGTNAVRTTEVTTERRTAEEAMGPTKARSRRKDPPRGRRPRASRVRRIPQRWIRRTRAAARRAARFTRVWNGRWRRRDRVT